jgi:hypothetical protein
MNEKPPMEQGPQVSMISHLPLRYIYRFGYNLYISKGIKSKKTMGTNGGFNVTNPKGPMCPKIRNNIQFS